MRSVNALVLMLPALRAPANGEAPPTPQPRPFFQLEPVAKRALAAKAATLRVGNSYETVVRAPGVPGSDQVMMRKENNVIRGRSLKYYALKLHENFVNELYDEYVFVYLDPNGKVESIVIRLTLTQ